MGQKTYNKFVAGDTMETDAVADASSDQSNPEPFKPWTGFNAFWHEFCRSTGANPKWKEMVQKHIEKLGWLDDQTKWMDGVKHFGL